MDEPSEETAVIEEKGKDSSNGSIVEVSKGEAKSKGDGGDTSAVLDRDEQNTVGLCCFWSISLIRKKENKKAKKIAISGDFLIITESKATYVFLCY